MPCGAIHAATQRPFRTNTQDLRVQSTIFQQLFSIEPVSSCPGTSEHSSACGAQPRPGAAIAMPFGSSSTQQRTCPPGCSHGKQTDMPFCDCRCHACQPRTAMHPDIALSTAECLELGRFPPPARPVRRSELLAEFARRGVSVDEAGSHQLLIHKLQDIMIFNEQRP